MIVEYSGGLWIGSLLAADDYAHFKTYMIASIPGIFSLFPLLFTPNGEIFRLGGTNDLNSGTETLIKAVYSIIWGVMIIRPLHKQVYE